MHSPARRIVESDRNTDPRRQAADVGTTSGARARRQRCCQSEARLEIHVLGKLLWTEELEQTEEPVGVILEWGRTQEQDMTTQAGDRRDCAPAGLAGVARRAAKPVCFVYDEEIDSRFHRLVGQLRALSQHLQRDDGTTVHVERVEVVAEVARHVGEARRIEKGEDLVVLAPELAQPLNRQGIRCDNEAAFDFSGMHEPIQDQRRFDRLPEADLVGEQPAHRVAGARPLRDVELVREEPDASPEEGAQAVGFANAEKVQDIETGYKIIDLVEIAQEEPFEECAVELEWPHLMRRGGVPVCELKPPIREARGDRRVLEGGGNSDRPPGAQIDGDERICVGRQPQRGSGAPELDDECSTVERGHASHPQLGVEAVTQVVTWNPGATRRLFHDRSPTLDTLSFDRRLSRSGTGGTRAPMSLTATGARVLSRLRRYHVLGARAFGSLADGERDFLAFAHGVEGRTRARGLVKEVFGAVRRGDKAEAFVGDALDRAGCC